MLPDLPDGPGRREFVNLFMIVDENTTTLILTPAIPRESSDWKTFRPIIWAITTFSVQGSFLPTPDPRSMGICMPTSRC